MKYVLVAVLAGACVLHADGLYSSFYEPLYNPAVLGYRVETSFRPEDARAAREQYRQKYGERGERLIAALGSGTEPAASGGRSDAANMYGDVKFYSIYLSNYNK